MTISLMILAALAGTIPLAAGAQSNTDDVRCVLLSAGFARAAKDENSRRASSMTGAFFLGRLSSRMSDAALTAAIRAQGKGLSAARAEPIMRACAARAGAAEQRLSAAAKQAEAGR